jgi:hypothetical protein
MYVVLEKCFSIDDNQTIYIVNDLNVIKKKLSEKKRNESIIFYTRISNYKNISNVNELFRENNYRLRVVVYIGAEYMKDSWHSNIRKDKNKKYEILN